MLDWLVSLSQGPRRVVLTVRRDLCSREKSSTDRSKSSAHAARGTGGKIQGLSALPEATLLCTQASVFSSMVTCGLQLRLEPDHTERAAVILF